MPEEKNPQNQAGTDNVSNGQEELSKLKEQIEGLNKGISSYRSDLKGIKAENQTLKEELEVLKAVSNDDDEDDDELDLHPDDQKKLEIWKRKAGLLTKGELEEQKRLEQIQSQKSVESQAVSEFLEKNPEFDTDENWPVVMKEFSLYRTPSTLSGYKELLNKIKKDLVGSPEKAREEGKAQAMAELKTKSRLSLGGGNKGSPEQEEQIAKLQEKYPHLTRDAIERRVAEIDSIYKK